MVSILRQHSCNAVQQGQEGDMRKFARGVRFTSKKQREMYQRQVNEKFKKQMMYLSQENTNFINDTSCDEWNESDTKQKEQLLLEHANVNKPNLNTVQIKEEIEINNIKDIPNYEILLLAATPGTAAAYISAAQQNSGLNMN